jgi:hypothetical protein
METFLKLVACPDTSIATLPPGEAVVLRVDGKDTLFVTPALEVMVKCLDSDEVLALATSTAERLAEIKTAEEAQVCKQLSNSETMATIEGLRQGLVVLGFDGYTYDAQTHTLVAPEIVV